MKFNYTAELKKFKHDFDYNKKTMLISGMNESNINLLYEYDYKEFKNTRNYYIHKEEYVCEYDNTLKTEDIYDNLFSIQDQIENKTLLQGLRSLKKSDYELFIDYAVNGTSIKELSHIYSQTQSNICQKIKRIKKYLREYMENSKFAEYY